MAIERAIVSESLAEEFLPLSECGHDHSVVVRATVDRLYGVARQAVALAFGDTRPAENGRAALTWRSIPLTLALFWLRGLPARLVARERRAGGGSDRPGLGWVGFVRLGERAPREIVVGAAGRFWTLGGDLDPVSPDAFREYRMPGCARMVMTLRVDRIDAATSLLSTTTRIAGCDGVGSRRFRLYWFFIGPFSALIRREILGWLKREAEGAGGSPTTASGAPI
jgi:hypothetical protein